MKSICRTRPHECLVDQRISRAKARYWLAWKRHSAIDSTMETSGFWTTDRQIANNLILVSDLVALVPISRDTRIAPSRWKHKWKKKKKNKRNGSLKKSLVNVSILQGYSSNEISIIIFHNEADEKLENCEEMSCCSLRNREISMELFGEKWYAWHILRIL